MKDTNIHIFEEKKTHFSIVAKDNSPVTSKFLIPKTTNTTTSMTLNSPKPLVPLTIIIRQFNHFVTNTATIKQVEVYSTTPFQLKHSHIQIDSFYFVRTH